MTRAIRCQLGSCKWNHELTCTSREPIELEYTNTDEILEIDEAEEAELKEFLVCKNYTEVENKQELELCNY
jgi:hypothetical protein